MDLTEDDVAEILDVIEKSNFEFLQLEIGEMRLTVSKSGYVPQADAPSGGATPMPAPAAAPAATKDAPAAPPQAAAADIPEGLTAIEAPMIGTFYVAPEPGADPFVTPGDKVTEDTTVGLIEVMKVFTSVNAGLSGEITEVVAVNAAMVERGQVLFLVKPDPATGG